MPKFEKPQKGNPHKLAINQHPFPSMSIARFAGADGKVDLKMCANNIVRRAKPDDSMFCARRAWDHRSEAGFMKKIEDDFQRIAQLILDNNLRKFTGEQTHAISSFYALWMARAELRYDSKEPPVIKGIIPGRQWSKDDEERLEKAGLVFLRENTIPSHLMNGMQAHLRLAYNLRQVSPTAAWILIRAKGGEFVVPDWPVHGFIPLAPTLALANQPIDPVIDRTTVALVNKQLKSVSRKYFFARDLTACP